MSTQPRTIQIPSVRPRRTRRWVPAGTAALRVPGAGYRIDVDSSVGTERVDVAEDPSAPRSLSVRAAVGSISVTPR
jgi:hypothetical protein